MDKEMYQEWLENPATEYFFKYLKDSAKEESEMVADVILEGGYLEKEEQIRISSICATLIRISDIEYDEIESFYNEKE